MRRLYLIIFISQLALIGAENETKESLLYSQKTKERKFPRYAEIKTCIENLAKTHRDILRNFTIGRSYEGRDIPCVKISTGPTSDGSSKPAILIDAGLHAREWISVTSALYAIEQLVELPSNRHILDKVDVYVIPILNPDGYEFSHLSPVTRLWRKTRSKYNSNCTGVDLNRNFDVNWNAPGILNSGDPCSLVYSGTSPLSEPESQVLANFIKRHKGTFKVYVSLHSPGNYIFYPWGYKSQSPPNEELLRCTATEAAKALSTIRNSAYVTKEIGKSAYPASGMSMDYVMAHGGVDLSFTIELTNAPYEFRAPTSEIEPVGREVFEALKIFAGYVEGKVCANLRP